MSLTLGATASTYAVLCMAGATNTGPTTLVGSLGSSTTGTFTNTGGFTQTGGGVHLADSDSTTAQSEVTTAYVAGNALPLTVAGVYPGGNDLSGVALGGTITTLSPGVYSFSSTAGLTSGTLTLNGGGDTNSLFVFQIGSALTVASGTIMALSNGANSCNVYWLMGSAATLGTTSTNVGNFIAQTSVTANTGAQVDGRLFARTGAVTLDQNVVDNTCICYVKGTKIMTPNGYVVIEDLSAGDDVVSCGLINGYKAMKNKDYQETTQKVVWVGHFTARNLNVTTRPICIKQNALGDNVPSCDIFVSPNHGVLVNNKFVSAKTLINGTSIYQDMSVESVEYYHLETEEHCVLMADGLMAESFLNSNTRVAKNSFVENITCRDENRTKLVC